MKNAQSRRRTTVKLNKMLMLQLMEFKGHLGLRGLLDLKESKAEEKGWVRPGNRAGFRGLSFRKAGGNKFGTGGNHLRNSRQN
jgi:hypothetical protein